MHVRSSTSKEDGTVTSHVTKSLASVEAGEVALLFGFRCVGSIEKTGSGRPRFVVGERDVGV